MNNVPFNDPNPFRSPNPTRESHSQSSSAPEATRKRNHLIVDAFILVQLLIVSFLGAMIAFEFVSALLGTLYSLAGIIGVLSGLGVFISFFWAIYYAGRSNR